MIVGYICVLQAVHSCGGWYIPHHHHSATCVEKSDFTIPRQVSRSCMAVSSSLWAIPESLLKISGYDSLLLLLPLGLGLQKTKEEVTSLVARWQCPANCNLRKVSVYLLDGGVALPGEAFDAHEEFCISAIKSCMLLRWQCPGFATVEQNRFN